MTPTSLPPASAARRFGRLAASPQTSCPDPGWLTRRPIRSRRDGDEPMKEK